jgi:hypothetical protein
MIEKLEQGHWYKFATGIVAMYSHKDADGFLWWKEKGSRQPIVTASFNRYILDEVDGEEDTEKAKE